MEKNLGGSGVLFRPLPDESELGVIDACCLLLDAYLLVGVSWLMVEKGARGLGLGPKAIAGDPDLGGHNGG